MEELKQAFQELDKSIARLKKSLERLIYIGLFGAGFILGLIVGLVITK